MRAKEQDQQPGTWQKSPLKGVPRAERLTETLRRLAAKPVYKGTDKFPDKSLDKSERKLRKKVGPNE